MMHNPICQCRPHGASIKQRLSRITAALLTLCTLTAPAADTNQTSTAVTATNSCPQFTLQDQYGHTHRFSFPQTKPVVLTVADKKGSDDIEHWVHPLVEKFGDKIVIEGLADVSSAPRPLHGLVLSRFKKAISHPVMLDWKGDVAKDFSYTKGEANVYVIASDGRILLHRSGRASKEQLQALQSLIEAQLETTGKRQSKASDRPTIKEGELYWSIAPKSESDTPKTPTLGIRNQTRAH